MMPDQADAFSTPGAKKEKRAGSVVGIATAKLQILEDAASNMEEAASNIGGRGFESSAILGLLACYGPRASSHLTTYNLISTGCGYHIITTTGTRTSQISRVGDWLCHLILTLLSDAKQNTCQFWL